jgi:uncharacterized membrane protein YjjP (DUF1212 family)
MDQRIIVEPQEFGSLLLEIGSALLRSGASSNRILLTLSRIADAYQFKTHVDISPKSVTLTLQLNKEQSVFTGTRSIPAQGVNFKIISGISRLSWSVVEKQWTLHQVRAEVDRLLNLPPYPRLVILGVVSLAGAAFCFTFGGSYPEMGITFGATFFGLFIKQELLKNKFNTYICTFLSALSAAFFTGIFYKLETGLELEHAFATSVLFLIPGVPLIISFTDMMDGNILNGIERGINALMHALAIAMGLAAAMLIFNIR